MPVEAIAEIIDEKDAFYSSIRDILPQQTILCTNSSTLLPSAMMGFTGREDRFLALHFANNIWKNNTAEVMGTPKTSEESYKAVVEFARAIGMIALELKKEQPGYLLNSMLVPFLNSAEALLANYTSSSKTNPSLAVVYGIKARAYLWLGGFDSSKYADAATYARKAIDASKCTIMTEAEWLNPKTGFNKANNSWMWYLPQSTEGIANLVNFAAWRSSEATWGYGGKYVFEGVTSNFYNEISDTDWRKRAFVGPDAKYADYSDITNLTAAQFANLPAYANLKFHPAEGETATYSVGNVTDIPMMRVEEMYLIEAEATAHADASAGLQLLKTFMAKRDPEFSTSAVSSADVVEEIIWNKRIELWGEGVVFYDFKRLNYSLKTGYVGTNVPSDCRFSTDGRAPWWNFCIPETETQQNTALESQNNPNPVGIIDPWVQ